jgi:hypothetical protein
MFVKPNAFEYLLFGLDKWGELSQIEQVRAALYFSRDRSVPDSWQALKQTTELFEKFISEEKVIRMRR